MEIFCVDAFTSVPFAGNPAGVCLVDREVTDAWMQAVAAEMNLSETAFVVRQPNGFGLRWFTPTIEVDLCGHATLAAAHVLFEAGEPADVVAFATASGELAVRRGAVGLEMNFPALPAQAVPVPAPLRAAIGVDALWTGRNRFVLVVEVANEAIVRDLAPARGPLLEIGGRSVIVTAVAGADTPGDFVSRCFGPAVGIDEDPVTGSAHCALGPYWGARLNKDELVGCQLSRRGGIVGVRVLGDRVLLRGEAVTVVRGSID
jgi:predicted PhzF superfamily epimerase YddE/YHI9